uniref:Uncharacterized protein n=1 Tax=Sphaerodactylus townsendi TaxID=933632 RepID=A0ACB8FPN2_9SAUR
MGWITLKISTHRNTACPPPATHISSKTPFLENGAPNYSKKATFEGYQGREESEKSTPSYAQIFRQDPTLYLNIDYNLSLVQFSTLSHTHTHPISTQMRFSLSPTFTLVILVLCWIC